MKLLDDVAKEFHLPPIPWGSVDIGCFPSGSSIPAKDQRSLISAYSEVYQWLKSNPNAFVMIYHDDQGEMAKIGKVDLLVKAAQTVFGNVLLTPPEFDFDKPLNQYISKGKRVMINSRTNYGSLMNSTIFYRNALCGWTEPSLSSINTSSCTVSNQPTMNGIIYRPETAELMYGPIDGSSSQILNTTTLPNITECSINLPSPGQIVPNTLAAQIWSFSENENPADGTCAVMTPKSSRWFVGKGQICDRNPQVQPCSPDTVIGARQCWKQCTHNCACPVNAKENKAVFDFVKLANLNVTVCNY